MSFPRPRRAPPRRFAGWSVLGAAGLAVFLSGPAQTYGVSPFVEPMLTELGLSRSVFSLAYSAGTLASAGVLLVVGRQIDRLGNRAVLLAASVAFGAALLMLSAVNSIVALIVGFAVLRSAGSGVLNLAARTLIPHWFVQRRGRAFSLLGVAALLSVAIVPPINEVLIAQFGWREAWRIAAVAVSVLLLPAIALLIWDRPEAVGQRPDGVRHAPDAAAPDDTKGGYTLHEAMRTPAFWGLILAGAVPSLVFTGLSFNQVAIFTDRGLSSTLSAATFTVESLAAFPVTLLAGWLVDRFPIRYALAAGQIALAIALAVLLVADAAPLAMVYAAGRGVAAALWSVAGDVGWPAYFGRRHLGSIRGVGFAVGVAGAALGPIPFGLAYDLLGGYNAAIVGLLILPVAAAVVVLWARPPELEAGG